MAQKIGNLAYTLARQLLVKDKGGIASLPDQGQILSKVQDIFQMLKAGGYNPVSADKSIKSVNDLKKVLTDIEMKQQIQFNLAKNRSEGLETVLEKMDKGIPLNPSDQAKVEGVEKLADDEVLDAFKGFKPKIIQGGKSEGIEKLLKSGDVKMGVAPKTTKTKPKVDPELQAMTDQNEMFIDFSNRIKGMSSTDRVSERLKDLKGVNLSELSGIEAQKIASEVIGRKGPFKTISNKGAKEVLGELEPIIKRADAEVDLGTKLKNFDGDPDAMAMGGRIGFNRGSGPGKGIMNFIKKLSEKSPAQRYKDYLASVKKRSIEGDFKSLAPELAAISSGGILVNRKMKRILEEGNEQQKERFLKEYIEELNNDPSYKDRPELRDKLIANYTESLFGEKRAMGGRIGFDKGGPSSKGRRNFLKLLGGLASIPVFGKLFKAAKPAAKVAKTVEQTTSGVPAYFPKLVEKIKMLGNDVTEIAATKERQKVTKYKGYELTEEIDTGKKEIKLGDAEYGSEEYMIYDPPETIIGKNNKPVEVPAQYEEVTVKPDMDGKMKDVDVGLDSIDQIMKDADIIETNYKMKPDGRPKKSGGGVAYMLGE